jgi:hypothetical protein
VLTGHLIPSITSPTRIADFPHITLYRNRSKRNTGGKCSICSDKKLTVNIYGISAIVFHLNFKRLENMMRTIQVDGMNW